MAIIKCKMCGGDLEMVLGTSVAECQFCGTRQTLPKAHGEVVQNLFNRANALRLKCEFDKAEQIYERILQEDDTEAEAHWGIVLCKYGIEYVEDPKTHKRVPTCHRTSYDAVTADEDHLAALRYADVVQRSIYEAEARAIDQIQKDILSIVKEERPFDVFICYKQTDEYGRRTIDSALANDIYHQLTQEGLKVFFAAITLEDKLGQEYEPYIFAALNSAKVMLVIGSKPQYFTAVWVKNEWSRFLKLMKSDRSKLLIPCYKDMDAYELPEEFAHLQAQDMSKIGFINDVIRGVRRVIADQTPKQAPVKETVVAGNANIAPLLKRAFMFLEDGEWASASEYCERVLDSDPENARAYLGKLMAGAQVRKQEQLKDQAEPFDSDNNYQKAVRFADDQLKATLTGYIEYIKVRNEKARLEEIYRRAKEAMAVATTESEYKAAAQLFKSIGGSEDASALARECYDKAECARKDGILAEGRMKMIRGNVASCEAAIELFVSISGWKDADEKVVICKQMIAQIIAQQEAKRLERERRIEIEHREAEKRKKRRRAFIIIASVLACTVILFVILWAKVIVPNGKYDEAAALAEEGKEAQAAVIFGNIPGVKDAQERSMGLWGSAAVRDTISAGWEHTVGLKADGTVVAVGYEGLDRLDVDGWTDIVAISAGPFHTVGLKADGTVVVAGGDYSDRGDVDDWSDIVAISAGYDHTVGLKMDGTVVAVGENEFGQCEVDEWKEIISISAGDDHTVGLKMDGTVVAVGSNAGGQCDVDGWTDIIAISAGNEYTLGLKADGTVVAVGSDHYDRCDVDGWTDIVAISAGDWHTVGLKMDGTAVAVGSNDHSQCEVEGWTDIVAISAGDDHTVGLKEDGTVVAVGDDTYDQCDVGRWTDIRIP